MYKGNKCAWLLLVMTPSFTQPTLALFGNLNTAPTYPQSDKRSRTAMLLGLEVAWRTNPLLLFHGASSPVLLFILLLPEMSPIPPYRAMIYVLHVRHSLKRCSIVCLSPAHIQVRLPPLIFQEGRSHGVATQHLIGAGRHCLQCSPSLLSDLQFSFIHRASSLTSPIQ